MKKQDLNGVRTPLDVERRHKLGAINQLEADVDELKEETIIDSSLSTTSTHAVENKVITGAINNIDTNKTNKNEIINTINNSNEEHIINNNKINMIINNNESNLKNIESYSNALAKVSGTDIYKFNFSNEGLGAKKTIGFIVGDTEYTEDIVGTKDGFTGADLFSMVSVLWQAVKEIGSSGVSDIYSTTETQTNKVWIDNKPIYRKVIDFTTGSTANNDYTFNHNISNIDKIVNITGIGYRANDGMYRPIPDIYQNMSGDFALTIYWANRTSINIGYGSYRTNEFYYLVIEYTKTN